MPMRLVFATTLVLCLMPGVAMAQATCRAKCTDDEQACLTRTSNKSQCGDRAKTCLDKCK
jgi:hypothetical protein